MPFAVDQPFWGARVAALGVGPTPIPRRRLTAENLGAALRATVADAGMAARASELGVLIRAEDGVGAAVRHLAPLAHRRRTPDEHPRLTASRLLHPGGAAGPRRRSLHPRGRFMDVGRPSPDAGAFVIAAAARRPAAVDAWTLRDVERTTRSAPTDATGPRAPLFRVELRDSRH